MSHTWFTADNHFGHKGILKFCPNTRPFQNLEEMEESMIDIWNATVRPRNHVWILGDLSFYGAQKTLSILQRLNGILHLVKGNHDRWLNQETKALLDEVHDYYVLHHDKQRLVMFHYPILEWDRMHYGTWHLHGHTHGNVKLHGKSLDVGIDNRPEGDCRLWHFDEVRQYMANQPIIQRTRVEL